MTRIARSRVRIVSTTNAAAEADITPPPPPPIPDPTQALVYSTTSNRSPSFDLDGATVAGNIYVFSVPNAPVTKVEFRLDGVLTMTDTNAPYDFKGGTTTAIAWDTTTASEGAHTITATWYYTAGGTVINSATLTVDNVAPPPPPTPTVDPSAPALAGCFQGGYSSFSDMGPYENWLGHPVTWMLAFYPFGNSAAAINAAKNNTRWKMILTVRLYDGGAIDGGSRTSMLQSIANGSQDAEWREVATNVVNAGLPYPIVLRLGHECNGDWYSWSTPFGQEALYVAAYRRAVNEMRSVGGFSGKALFDWNTSCGAGSRTPGGNFADPEDQYPGDAYVDIISNDIYSNKRNSGVGAGPTASIFDGPRGFDWSANWARSHNKPFAVNEWSVRDVEDVTFITTMFNKLKACEHLHHHIQYDFHDYHRLSPPTIFPDSAAEFKRTDRFG